MPLMPCVGSGRTAGETGQRGADALEEACRADEGKGRVGAGWGVRVTCAPGWAGPRWLGSRVLGGRGNWVQGEERQENKRPPEERGLSRPHRDPSPGQGGPRREGLPLLGHHVLRQR